MNHCQLLLTSEEVDEIQIVVTTYRDQILIFKEEYVLRREP